MSMGTFWTYLAHILLLLISYSQLGCMLSASLLKEGIFSSTQDIRIVEQVNALSASPLDSLKKYKLISQQPLKPESVRAEDFVHSGSALGVVVVVEPTDLPFEFDIYVSVSSQEGTVVLELPDGAVEFQDGTTNIGTRSDESVSTFAAKQSRVAVGEEHLCYVDQAKAIRCQGYYYGGQTGIGDSSSGSYYTGRTVDTSLITGSGEFVKASGASYSSCALSKEGQLYCWGDNYEDELGIGPGIIEVLLPTPALMTNVTGEGRFIDFALAHESLCAISIAGDLYCAGKVSSATTGLLTKIDWTSLAQSAARIVQVSVGYDFACGLTEHGRIFCWGVNDQGQLGDGTFVDSAGAVLPDWSAFPSEPKFIHLASGEKHTCGVTVEGLVYCWGSNSYGQLGDGTDDNRATPVLVVNSMLSGSEKFQAVTASYEGTCATSSAGKIYCFGSNWHYLSGNGSSEVIFVPTLVDSSMLPSGQRYREVYMHEGRTCGGSTGDELYCWGSPYNEAFFRDTEAFVPVEVDTSVLPPGQYWSAVTQYSGGRGLVLRSSDGTAYALGSGSPGTENGDLAPRLLDTSTMSGSTKFKMLTLNRGAICGINNDDILHCMGWGAVVGQGGAIVEQTTLKAVDTSSMTGATTFADVEMGEMVACGVATDGIGYCWGGSSFSGGLNNPVMGNGSAMIRYKPHPITVTGIAGAKTFKKISVGLYHACGLMTDGEVYCWGNSVYSRLGHSSMFSVYTPAALDKSGMVGSTLFKDIHGDDETFCGITTDDITHCWGEGYYGNLGNNTAVVSNSPVPVSVGGLLAPAAPLMVKSFERFACGILDSAINIYCWGRDIPAGLSDSVNPLPVAVLKTGMLGTPVSISGGDNLYVTTSANKIYCIGRDCNLEMDRTTPRKQFFENY